MRISARRKPNKPSAGFTLIEILLVVALLGLLASSAVPSLKGVFRVSVQSGVRRYAAMVRFAYDNAVLTGRLHRIVLDLNQQKWRVEAAEAGQLPLDKTKAGLLAEGMREDERVTVEPAFKPVDSNLSGEIPRGVELLAIESFRFGKANRDEVRKALEGLERDKNLPEDKRKEREREIAAKSEFSIYAYPSGFVDEASVTLAETGKEEAQKFVVTTKSLSGRVKVDTVNQPGAAR